MTAAWGAAESAWHVGWAPPPSIGRRALGIVLWSLVVHAAFGAVLGGFAATLARAAGRRAATVLVALPASLVLATLALWWLGDVALDERELWRCPRRWRVGALLAALGLALLGGLSLAIVLGADRVTALRTRLRPERSAQVAGTVLLLSLLFAGWAGRRAADTERRPAPGRALPSPGAAPQHVLVVLVDTLRADALSCYGAPPGRTPHIDVLARRGVLFETAQAPTSWTLPSVATLLTGAPPAEHGVVEFSSAIEPTHTSFVERFASAGFDCTAFVGNFLVRERNGFGRGFRLFDSYAHQLEGRQLLQDALFETARLLGLVRYPARRNHVLQPSRSPPFVTTRLPYVPQDADIVDALRRYAPPDAERPSLTYVHLVGPHDPYLELPTTFAKQRTDFLVANLARLRELYADEIRRLDAVLGELLAAYERAGILEDTLVVLTSDHGEEFQEHGGFTHGHTLYEEVVRIPLIVAGPGVAEGRRVSTRVQLGDVAPTLLARCALPRPPTMTGADLGGWLASDGTGSEVQGRHFAELTSSVLNRDVHAFSVVEGRWKLLREHHVDGTVDERLFDLERDPLEQEPLALPAALAALRRELLLYEDSAIRLEGVELDAEELERVRALGYLGEE